MSYLYGYDSPSPAYSGSFNSMLLGRMDYSVGGYGRSPMMYSSGILGPSYGGGGYGGYGTSYGGPSLSYLPNPLQTIGEHSALGSPRRLKKNYNLSPGPALPLTRLPSLRPNKLPVFHTELIDVTTPREAETKEIARDRSEAFGTLRRGRTVVRMETQHQKDNPRLVEEPKVKKKPKKTAGQKLKEKYLVGSVKKRRSSAYRRPTLNDLRLQQEERERELDEVQATGRWADQVENYEDYYHAEPGSKAPEEPELEVEAEEVPVVTLRVKLRKSSESELPEDVRDLVKEMESLELNSERRLSLVEFNFSLPEVKTDEGHELEPSPCPAQKPASPTSESPDDFWSKYKQLKKPSLTLGLPSPEPGGQDSPDFWADRRSSYYRAARNINTIMESGEADEGEEAELREEPQPMAEHDPGPGGFDFWGAEKRPSYCRYKMNWRAGSRRSTSHSPSPVMGHDLSPSPPISIEGSGVNERSPSTSPASVKRSLGLNDRSLSTSPVPSSFKWSINSPGGVNDRSPSPAPAKRSMGLRPVDERSPSTSPAPSLSKWSTGPLGTNDRSPSKRSIDSGFDSSSSASSSSGTGRKNKLEPLSRDKLAWNKAVQSHELLKPVRAVMEPKSPSASVYERIERKISESITTKSKVVNRTETQVSATTITTSEVSKESVSERKVETEQELDGPVRVKSHKTSRVIEKSKLTVNRRKAAQTAQTSQANPVPEQAKTSKAGSETTNTASKLNSTAETSKSASEASSATEVLKTVSKPCAAPETPKIALKPCPAPETSKTASKPCAAPDTAKTASKPSPAPERLHTVSKPCAEHDTAKTASKPWAAPKSPQTASKSSPAPERLQTTSKPGAASETTKTASKPCAEHDTAKTASKPWAGPGNPQNASKPFPAPETAKTAAVTPPAPLTTNTSPDPPPAPQPSTISSEALPDTDLGSFWAEILEPDSSTLEITSTTTTTVTDLLVHPAIERLKRESQGSSVSSTTSSSDGSSDESVSLTPKVCNVNCHHKCEIFMPNLCGVNQKLLAEALSSLKKGGSSTSSSSTTLTGTSSAGSSRRMPSPPSDPESEEDEEVKKGKARQALTQSESKVCPSKVRPKYRCYHLNDFQFLKVLGKGSFGKVLLAELKGTDSYFAVKCLKKDVVLEDDDVECTMIERKVLLIGSKHPYLCHLLCTFQSESHLFFAMEYLNGGDLMFHIQQSGRFSEERGRFYAAEIVSGLKFLHKKGVIYRDLKLDNILLDFEGHVRIADFGMCKLQIFLDRTADTFCGTPDYMAPEIIKGLRYNQCVDWWAFGVLLYEMLVGQSPFSGSDEDQLFWSICNDPAHFPRFLSREAKRILELLLEKDGFRRLGSPGYIYGDIKEQPFFHSIDWDLLEKRELEPPFKPKLRDPLDVKYFDTTFTKEAARLTPVDKEILRSMDQTQFDGFSYTNPHTTD